MRVGSVFSRKLALIFSGLLIAIMATSVTAALDDPTRPPGNAASKAASRQVENQTRRWELSSTLVSPGRRTAVLNGYVVSVGDRIAGATVLAIEPNRVRIKDRGREVTLVMLNQQVKTPSRQPDRLQGKQE